MPFAVITIIVDLIVIIETGVVLFKIREIEPYFSAFLSTYGGLINDIAYGGGDSTYCIAYKTIRHDIGYGLIKNRGTSNALSDTNRNRCPLYA